MTADDELKASLARVGQTEPALFVLGPEDTVLQKLRWFELGGRTSDRQWRDIIGVLRLGGELDLGYTREVAAGGNLGELLERALSEAGR